MMRPSVVLFLVFWFSRIFNVDYLNGSLELWACIIVGNKSSFIMYDNIIGMDEHTIYQYRQDSRLEGKCLIIPFHRQTKH